MSKFVIENTIIEKSDKDITTGINYEFCSGLNIICGNNEAGKSSLMQFIKQGFFRPNKIDKGKIFFSIIEDNKKTNYRVDISNASKKDKRCIVYDNNNSQCDYSIIEELINQKYFEQGFTINLDDLMNLQYDNNTTLINVIKDPSGDKLNNFFKVIDAQISKFIGLNGKPKNTITDITSQIGQLNNKINELSQKETQYNNAILSIQNLENELSILSEKEEYIEIIEQIRNAKAELTNIDEHKKNISIEFNEKLHNQKEKYIEIIQDTGKYESNNERLINNNQKVEAINAKINANKERLNFEYGLNPSEEDLGNFVIDYEKINQIKEILSQIDELKQETKAYEKSIEDLEQNLLKLKNDLENILASKQEKLKQEELEDIFQVINEGFKQYKFLEAEINNIYQTQKVNSKGIFSNRNSNILFGALFLLTASCAVISFIQNVPTAGIFSIFMALLVAVGFGIQKLSNYNNFQSSDKIRKQTQQEVILSNIIEKLKIYYPEIENVESSYLPTKIDDLKQEIAEKISISKSFNEKVSQNENDRKFNELKIENINEKISNINNNIKTKYDEINAIININNGNINIPANKYTDVIEIIKSIKNELNEKKLIEKELTEIKANNDEIIKKFNDFIIENNIDINIGTIFKENIEKLRLFNETNSKLKQQLDICTITYNNIYERIQKLENSTLSYGEKYKDILLNSNLKEVLDNTIEQKKLKQSIKKELEFQKRELEDFEGITNLKNEKNLLINELRNIVKSLYINKSILKITSIAKANFDKTQPDLINAQKYLSILTDGKYTRINLETEEIMNNDNSQIKKWDELSRGTKEQLYLALRLGYASNYSKDKTTLEPNGKADLPIIIDDAFVNFDYERTHNALKCLLDFAKTNQVLFFTCHTDVIKKHFDEIGITENNDFKVIYIK